MVSIAPMMDWTTRHYRYFMRRITKRTLLYTEMITAAAIVYGDAPHLLRFHPDEHPLALQLGGDDPGQLVRAMKLAEPFGYDEYNLNVGCPSPRVQRGNFGAVLMEQPELVAGCVRAMRDTTDRPVTVKHRIGVEGCESYDDMRRFVDTVVAAGARRCTVHARIAILEGLDAKENRTIPPLRYEDVYRLKRELPTVPIEINGGIHDLMEVRRHLERVDAVMIGRSAYAKPYLFATVDRDLFGVDAPVPSRREVAESMYEYVDEVRREGVPPRRVFAAMLGLFAGLPGARAWKRLLSGRLPEEGSEILVRALAAVPEESKA